VNAHEELHIEARYKGWEAFTATIKINDIIVPGAF